MRVLVIGCLGAGKTTLARLIARSLRPAADPPRPALLPTGWVTPAEAEWRAQVAPKADALRLRHRRADMAPGCRERFDRAFIAWVWNYPHRSRPKTLRLLAVVAKPVVSVKRVYAVERWVERGMPLEGSG